MAIDCCLILVLGPRPFYAMRTELKLNLADVSQVILSHHHGDHTGGLLTLRRELGRQNPKALERAYVWGRPLPLPSWCRRS